MNKQFKDKYVIGTDRGGNAPEIREHIVGVVEEAFSLLCHQSTWYHLNGVFIKDRLVPKIGPIVTNLVEFNRIRRQQSGKSRARAAHVLGETDL